MKRFFLISVLFFSLTISLVSQPGNTENDALISEFVQHINADSIQSYMKSLQDFGTRFALADNRREVALWIKNKFKSFGYGEVRLDSFHLNWADTWQFNVECTYTGHTYPDKVYILGAHHDAISSGSYFNKNAPAPGADDNASGVSAALEVARVLKTHNYIPESTIKFVTFAAEELGLYGAFHYASEAKKNNTDIVMMLNNDMISYHAGSAEDWEVTLIKYDNSEDITNLAKEIIENHTSLGYSESTMYSNASDSYRFYENGYKAIFFHEGEFTPDYHTENDLVANTNKYYAAEVTKISLGMLMHENGPGYPLHFNEHEPNDPLFYAYPNPFSQNTAISYQIGESGFVSIEIYDIFGRKVADLINKWHEPGSYQIELTDNNFRSGVYFCNFKTPHKNKNLKLFKSY
jgi:hypothetical protein